MLEIAEWQDDSAGLSYMLTAKRKFVGWVRTSMNILTPITKSTMPARKISAHWFIRAHSRLMYLKKGTVWSVDHPQLFGNSQDWSISVPLSQSRQNHERRHASLSLYPAEIGCCSDEGQEWMRHAKNLFFPPSILIDKKYITEKKHTRRLRLVRRSKIPVGWTYISRKSNEEGKKDEKIFTEHCLSSLGLDMINRVKEPIHTGLRTRFVGVEKNLFESIACLLFVGANVDGKGLPKISHVCVAIQLRQVTVHHQFKEANDLTILTTKYSIAFDTKFLETEKQRNRRTWLRHCLVRTSWIRVFRWDSYLCYC